MVSIIVPVFNVENYLKQCINSILTQTLSDIELILIDDGSTDSSGLICDYYAHADNRVKVVHKSNSGVSAARNEGLDLCSGDYIAFVDADDWIEEDMLQKMISAIEQSEVDFAVCNEIRVLDREKNNTKKVNHWKKLSEPTIVKKDGLYKKIYNNSAVLWNKIFKWDLIGKKRFNTSQKYGEDMCFFLDILDNANSAVIVPDHLYYYFCTRPGNVVSAKIDSRSLDLLNNAELVYRELVKRGYEEVGIRRIQIAINDVIKKIPQSELLSSQYSDYIKHIRRMLKKVSTRHLLKYLLWDEFPIKTRCSFFFIRFNLSIWIIGQIIIAKAKQIINR